jgi:hypothetical protein
LTIVIVMSCQKEISTSRKAVSISKPSQSNVTLDPAPPLMLVMSPVRPHDHEELPHATFINNKNGASLHTNIEEQKHRAAEGEAPHTTRLTRSQ